MVSVMDSFVQFRDIPRPMPASVVVRRTDGVPVNRITSPQTDPPSVAQPQSHEDAPVNPIQSLLQSAGRTINTVGRELDWKTTSGSDVAGWVSRDRLSNNRLQNLLDPVGSDGHRKPVLLTTVGNGHPPPDIGSQLQVPSQFNVLPLTPTDNQDLVVSEQTLKNKHTLYNADWLRSLFQNPWTIPEELFRILGNVGGYVVWTYADFVEKFKAWNGTWWGLVTNLDFLWRAGVTALVTWGLWQSSDILGMLWELLIVLGRILLDLISWATGATEFVFHWLGVLWNDTIGAWTTA